MIAAVAKIKANKHIIFRKLEAKAIDPEAKIVTSYGSRSRLPQRNPCPAPVYHCCPVEVMEVAAVVNISADQIHGACRRRF